MFNPDEKLAAANAGCGSCKEGCIRVWVCADKRSLMIKQMDDQHLLNSMLLVQRNHPWRLDYRGCLVYEAKRRGLI